MRKNWYRFLIGACVLFVTVLPAESKVGGLDPNFNLDGKISPLPGLDPESGHSVAVQSDGKIIVSGHKLIGGDSDIIVRRYNDDGSLDNSFGSSGEAVFSGAGGNQVAQAMILQEADDKIIIAGYDDNSGNQDFLVVRFNADGSLDTTFNTTGSLIHDFSGNSQNDQAHALALGTSGEIYVAGMTTSGDTDFAIARLTSAGQFDTSFNTNGKVTIDIGATSASIPASSNDVARGIGVLSATNFSRVVVAGSSNNAGTNEIVIVGLTATGSLDNNFSSTSDGVFTTTYQGEAYDLVINEFDEPVIAGYVYDNVTSTPSFSNDAAIIRLTANGSFDTNFSSGVIGDLDGMVLVDFNPGVDAVDDSSNDKFYALSYQIEAEKYLVAGSTTPFAGGTSDVLFSRILGDGDLDFDGTYQPPFDADGDYAKVVTTIDFLTNNDIAFGVTSDLNGRLLVSGVQTSADGSEVDFALARLSGGMFGSVIINNDYPKSALQEINLAVDCQSTIGNTISKMCILRYDQVDAGVVCRHPEDPTYDDSVWVPYSATTTAQLVFDTDDKTGELPQDFYVVCMDSTDEISDTYNDSIILDQIPPYLTIDVTSPSVGVTSQLVGGITDSGIEVTVSVSTDPVTTVSSVEYEYDGGSGLNWFPVPNPSPTAAPDKWRATVSNFQPGDNVVQAYSQDYLGNIAIVRGTISYFTDIGTPQDTDGDGMIDSFEDAFGFDKNDPSDGGTGSGDYFVTLENIDASGVPLTTYPDLGTATGDISFFSTLYTGVDCGTTVLTAPASPPANNYVEWSAAGCAPPAVGSYAMLDGVMYYVNNSGANSSPSDCNDAIDSTSGARVEWSDNSTCTNPTPGTWMDVGGALYSVESTGHAVDLPDCSDPIVLATGDQVEWDVIGCTLPQVGSYADVGGSLYYVGNAGTGLDSNYCTSSIAVTSGNQIDWPEGDCAVPSQGDYIEVEGTLYSVSVAGAARDNFDCGSTISSASGGQVLWPEISACLPPSAGTYVDVEGSIYAVASSGSERANASDCTDSVFVADGDRVDWLGSCAVPAVDTWMDVGGTLYAVSASGTAASAPACTDTIDFAFNGPTVYWKKNKPCAQPAVGDYVIVNGTTYLVYASGSSSKNYNASLENIDIYGLGLGTYPNMSGTSGDTIEFFDSFPNGSYATLENVNASGVSLGTPANLTGDTGAIEFYNTWPANYFMDLVDVAADGTPLASVPTLTGSTGDLYFYDNFPGTNFARLVDVDANGNPLTSSPDFTSSTGSLRFYSLWPSGNFINLENINPTTGATLGTAANVGGQTGTFNLYEQFPDTFYAILKDVDEGGSPLGTYPDLTGISGNALFYGNWPSSSNFVYLETANIDGSSAGDVPDLRTFTGPVDLYYNWPRDCFDGISTATGNTVSWPSTGCSLPAINPPTQTSYAYVDGTFYYVTGTGSGAGNDYDMDTLLNTEEFEFGTDPTNPDTDGDGIPDGHSLERQVDAETGLRMARIFSEGFELGAASLDNWTLTASNASYEWQVQSDTDQLAASPYDDWGDIIPRPASFSTNNPVYAGTYSVRVPDAFPNAPVDTDNHCTGMKKNITIGADGTLTFWWLNSSEPFFDNLEFWLNGSLYEVWDGRQELPAEFLSDKWSTDPENVWQQFTVPLDHDRDNNTIPDPITIEWRYCKDDFEDSFYDDSSWLDDIRIVVENPFSNPQIEDFESGVFRDEWILHDYPWSVVSNLTTPYNPIGNFSAGSPGPNGDGPLGTDIILPNDGRASMEMLVDCYEGDLTFWYQISAELTDKLYFYVDGIEKGFFDGSTGQSGWVEASFPILSGVHSFRWEYLKDGSVTNYPDQAFLDNIAFPGVIIPTTEIMRVHSVESGDEFLNDTKVLGGTWAENSPNKFTIAAPTGSEDLVIQDALLGHNIPAVILNITADAIDANGLEVYFGDSVVPVDVTPVSNAFTAKVFLNPARTNNDLTLRALAGFSTTNLQVSLAPQPSYIDWTDTSHGVLISGAEYVYVGGEYYLVTESGSDSWSGPLYNWGRLQVVDQFGIPQVDESSFPLYADMTGSERSAITVYNTWPLPQPDIDNDGMPDPWELLPDNSLLVCADISCNDADLDKDGDGLKNIDEFLNFTKANVKDTDGDGMWDFYEVYYGVLNPVFPYDATYDPDGDGLNNLAEFNVNQSPDANNQITDATNPEVVDTDIDGMDDLWEVTYGTNPVVFDANDDLDVDGLSNILEYQSSTYPNNVDSDDDGMWDYFEYYYSPTLDPTDPTDKNEDPDGDGLDNIGEFNVIEHVFDFNQISESTNPTVVDTDLDGMWDGYEVYYMDNYNGLKPLLDDAGDDFDGDCLSNLEEFELAADVEIWSTSADLASWLTQSTNPLVADTDGDGMGDSDEARFDLQIRIPDAYCVAGKICDLGDLGLGDKDGDEIPNWWEVKYALDAACPHTPGTNAGMNPNDASDRDIEFENGATGDGISNYDEYMTLDIFVAGETTDPLVDDTDGDGLLDGWEVTFYYHIPTGDFNPIDPLFTDSNGDYDAVGELDGDNLFNIDEQTFLTNPYLFDSDEDGMDDGWEVQYNDSGNGTIPSVDDAALNYDNDQYSNLQEYQNVPKTNPITEDDPPTGTVLIKGTNGTDDWTNSQNVTLEVTCTDASVNGSNSGCSWMRFSNDGIFDDNPVGENTWEAIQSPRPTLWPMTAGDGDKIVYVQFKDGAEQTTGDNTSGNVSAIFNDAIQFDETAPTTAHATPDAWYIVDTVVSITETDPLTGAPTPIASGVAETRWCIDSVVVGASEPAIPCDPWTGTNLNPAKEIPVTQAINTASDHYVRYQSIDVAQNLQDVQTVLVKIDKVLPITSSDAQTGWLSGSLTINFTIDDLDDVTFDPSSGGDYTLSCYAEAPATCDPLGTSGAPGSSIFIDHQGLVSKTYNVSYVSYDIAGNREAAVNTITVQVDTSLPTTSDNNPTPNPTDWINYNPGGANPDFIITPADTGSGVQYTYYCVDDSSAAVDCDPMGTSGTVVENLTPQTPTPIVVNLTPIASGSFEVYTVRYRSRDYAGNLQALVEPVVRIDLSDPVTTTDGNEPTIWTADNPATFDLNASDTGSGLLATWWCVDDGTATDCDPKNDGTQGINVSVSVGAGVQETRYVRFRSYDNSGNIEAVTPVSVDFDRKPPTTDVLNPPAQEWVNTDVTLTLDPSDTGVNASDPQNIISYFCVDTTGTGCDPDPLADGQAGKTVILDVDPGFVQIFDIYYYSVDTLGNEEAVNSTPLTIKIDQVVPDTSNTASLVWEATDQEFTLTVPVDNGAPVTTYWCVDTDGATCDPLTNTYNDTDKVDVLQAADSDQLYYVRYYSIDAAGNTEIASIKSQVVQIDKKKPTTLSADLTPTATDWVDGVSVAVTITPQDSGSGIAENYTCVEEVGVDPTCTPTLNNTGSAQFDVTLPDVLDGKTKIFLLRYYSIDGVNNQQDELQTTIQVDNTAPVTTTDGNEPTDWVFDNVSISLVPTDDASGVVAGTAWWCVDDEGATPACDPFSGTNSNTATTTMAVGSYGRQYVRFASVDNVGNIEVVNSGLYVDIDRAPPETYDNNPTPTTGDWVNESDVTVTLTPTDIGSGIAETYYCFEEAGQTACNLSPGYTLDTGTNPIDVGLPTVSDGNTKIYNVRYYSVDNSGYTQGAQLARVQIDNTDPVTFTDGNEPTDWVNSANVSFAISAIDDAGASGLAATYWCYDDGQTACDPFTVKSVSPVSVSMADDSYGTWYVRIASEDNSDTIPGTGIGNREVPKVFQIDMDRTLPTTSDDNPTPLSTDWVNTADVTVNLTPADTGSNVAENYWCIDEEGTGTCTPALQNTNTAEFGVAIPTVASDTTKIYNLRYYSVDGAGNIQTPIKVATVQNDRQAPDTTTPFDGSAWVSTSTTIVTLSPDDFNGSGIAFTKYCIDDVSNNCNPNQTGTSVTVNDTGEIQYVRFHSQDNMGNLETIDWVEVRVDTTPPTTTADSTTTNWDSAWVNEPSVVINLSPTDTGSGMGAGGSAGTFYCFDTVAAGNCTSWISGTTINLTQVDPDNTVTYYVRYYSDDYLGNSETPNDVTVRIDNTDPVTVESTTTPAPTAWVADTVNFDLDASDDASGVASTWWCVDDGVTPCDPINDPGTSGTSVSVTMNTDEAFDQYVRFASVDNAANEEAVGSNVILVQIDKARPTTSATSPTTDWNSAWVNEDVVITLTATDTGSGMSGGLADTLFCYDTISGCTSFNSGNLINLSTATDATYYVRYYSVDAVGNVEATIKEETVRIDMTTPQTAADDATTTWVADDQNFKLNMVADSGSPITSYYCIDKTGSDCQQSTDYSTYVDANGIDVLQDADSDASIIVYYYTEDDAGNTESPANTVTLQIDKNGPVTTVTGDVQDWDTSWVNQTVTLTLAPTDTGVDNGFPENIITLYCVDTSGGGCDPTGAQGIPGTEVVLSTGTFQEFDVYYYSLDSFLNPETVKNVHVAIDTVYPTVGNDAPSGWVNDADVVVNLSSSDDGSSIDGMAFCISTSLPNNCNPDPDNGGTPGTVIDLAAIYGSVAPGAIVQYYINYGAADFAGNVTLDSTTVSIDRAIPESYDDAPDVPVKDDVTITITEVDQASGSGVAATFYCIDTDNSCSPAPAADGLLYTAPVDLPVLSPGQAQIFNFKYITADNATNTVTSIPNIQGPVVKNVMIDKALPTGSVTINSNDPVTLDAVVTLNLTCNDAGSGCAFYRTKVVNEDQPNTDLTGLSWTAWPQGNTTLDVLNYNMVGAVEGTNEVYVEFKDAVENISSPAVRDAIEYLPPIPPIPAIYFMPGMTATAATTVDSCTVQWDPVIPDLGYKYTIERSTLDDFSSDVSVLSLDAGLFYNDSGFPVADRYYYRVRATKNKFTPSAYIGGAGTYCDVLDNQKPVIFLNDPQSPILEVGDTYFEYDAYVTDNYPVSASIVIDATAVDMNTVNTTIGYPVTYNVVDDSSNSAVQVVRTVYVADTTDPVITLGGDGATVNMEAGDSFTETVSASDVPNRDLTGDIVITGDYPLPDPLTYGTYTLYYNVSDGYGNSAVQQTRVITVNDTAVPVITLGGDGATVTMEAGDSFTETVSASDVPNRDLTGDIVITGDYPLPDPLTYGIYTLYYNVNDGNGNSAVQQTRVITVNDTAVPVITLGGDGATVTMEAGDSFTETVSASDVPNRDLTGDIVITGDYPLPDPLTYGIYTLNYNVSDGYGNDAVQATRVITVEDNTVPVITLGGAGATVTLEAGDSFTETVSASDIPGRDLTNDIVITGDYPLPSQLSYGTYTLYYNVSDGYGNDAVQATRVITVDDTIAPGLTDVTINDPDTSPVATNNHLVTLYVDCDAGVGTVCADMRFSNDATFGNQPEDLWRTYATPFNGWDLWTLDTNEESKTVWAQVRDGAGNASSVFQVSIFVDKTDPVITLNETGPGETTQLIFLGTPSTDPGATAVDADPAIDSKITSDWSTVVNINQVGDYVVTYNVTDWAENSAAPKFRTVTVYNQADPPGSITVPLLSNDGTYTVSWTISPSAGAIYVLEEATVSDFSDAAVVYSGGNLSYSATGRISGVSYYYRVKAVAPPSTDSVWTISANACDVIIPAVAPAWIWNPATDDDGVFTVDWADSTTPGAVYVLEQATLVDFSDATVTYSGVASIANLTGVAPDTYYYRVKTTAAGYDDSIWMTSGTPLNVLPPAAAPLWIWNPATDEDGTFSVDWGDSTTPGAIYILEQATIPDFSNVSVAYSGSASIANLSGVTPGTYYYRVKTTASGYVDSGWIVSGTSLVVLPPAAEPPWIFNPGSDDDGAFSVDWGDSTTPSAVYILEQATISDFSNASVVYSGGASVANLSGVTPGTYYYRVKTTATGYIDSGWIVSGTPLVELPHADAPSFIWASDTNTTGTISVDWGDSITPGATYQLHQASSPDFSDAVVVYDGPVSLATLFNRPNGTYYFRVKTIASGYVDSPYTVWSSGTVVVLTATAPSTIFVPSNNTSGTYTVDWGDAPAGADEYVLEQATIADFSDAVEIYRNTSSIYTMNGQLSGTYFYRVKTVVAGFADSPYVSGDNPCVVALTVADPYWIWYPDTRTKDTIAIDWATSTTPGAEYVLEMASQSDFSDAAPVYTGPDSIATVPVTNGVWYFRVKGTKTGFADSAYISSGTALTVNLIAEIPYWISVPASSAGDHTILWGISETASVEYVLEEATLNDFSDATSIYTGTNLSFLVTGRVPGTYYYRVKAIKGGYVDSVYRIGSSECLVQ